MFHIEVAGIPICQSTLPGRGQCVFHTIDEVDTEYERLRKLDPASPLAIVSGDCPHRMLEGHLITDAFIEALKEASQDKRVVRAAGAYIRAQMGKEPVPIVEAVSYPITSVIEPITIKGAK